MKHEYSLENYRLFRIDGNNLTMMNWENVRYFLALAEAGTLSGAARLLEVEHATVARRVESLEAEVGLKLIDRRGRRFLLTADGQQVVTIARQMNDQVHAISLLSASSNADLNATVTISAPPAFATARLAGPIAALSSKYPGLNICLLGETHYSSLERREADIAIRLTRPSAGDLAIRKLREEAFRPYANRNYLARTPREEWRFVAYDESLEAAPQQAYLLALADRRSIALRTNTLEIQHALVMAGGGIAMLPDFMVEGDDTIIWACPDQAPLKREVWMVVHTDMKSAPAIRAVINEITIALDRSVATADQ